MSITHISGDFMVIVDHVDIEQTCIEKGRAVQDFPLNLKAMVAALNNEDVKSFSRIIDKSNHCLQWESSHFGKDDIMVIFKIRAKKANANDA